MSEKGVIGRTNINIRAHARAMKGRNLSDTIDR